jgi:hypothetical protein
MVIHKPEQDEGWDRDRQNTSRSLLSYSRSFLSEQDEGWDRDRQNIVDLQNGGHKFLLDGKTLQLPGVTPSDSRFSM